MHKSRLIQSSAAIAALLMTLLSPSTASATGCGSFAGGDGTQGNPYQITNVAEFLEIENCSAGYTHFQLNNDIDFSDSTNSGTWAASDQGIDEFNGVLDGQGYELSNITFSKSVNQNGVDLQGLFSYVSGTVSNPAVIKALKIDVLDIEDIGAVSYAGLIPFADGSVSVSDVSITNATNESDSQNSGGLIGRFEGSGTSANQLVLEDLRVDVSLSCLGSNQISCGGVAGSVMGTPQFSADNVSVEVEFVALKSGTAVNQGGIIGNYSGNSDYTLAFEDMSILLQDPKDVTGGRIGGLIGRYNFGTGNEFTLTINRAILLGDIPQATESGAFIGFTLDSTVDEISLDFDEVIVALNIGSASSARGFFVGSGNATVDTTNATNVFEDSNLNPGSPVIGINNADRSKPDTYPGLAITDNLSTSADWYVQAADSEGELFGGYPVPYALANTDFFGNRLFFRSNGAPGPDVGRIGAGQNSTLEVIPNPFNRPGFEFVGWNNIDDGTGDFFDIGDSVYGSDGGSIYAIWRAPQSTPAPYTGPLITSVGSGSAINASSTETIRVSGERLGSVSGVLVDGKQATVVSVAADHFMMTLPKDLSPGTYDLVVQSSIGNLTYLDAITILGSSAASDSEPIESISYGEVSAWTKRISDTQVKVYVKYPTVGEKVRISHQTGGSGSYETVYVKTTSSETMQGLRTVEGVGTYIVRTIDLEEINRIRVTVGDEEMVQVRYNN